MKRPLIITLVVLLPMASVQAQTQSWKTEQPYQDNPLRRATLNGSGKTQGANGNVSLTLACRGDSPPAFVVLRVDEDLSKVFPTDLFEGPGAIGEKAKLISVKLGDRALQHVGYSSGAFQENSAFEWTFQPQKTELKRWLNAPSSALTVYVKTPGKTPRQLTASFILPQDAQGARETLAPCLKD
jgi:hypothetical protein